MDSPRHHWRHQSKTYQNISAWTTYTAANHAALSLNGQKSEIRSSNALSSRKSEVWRSDVWSRKLKVGSRKSEVESQKLEVGSWKLEVGSRKTLLGFRTSQSLNNNIVVCNRSGWDKNWTDFKRKGGLQAVYLQLTIQRWREREFNAIPVLGESTFHFPEAMFSYGSSFGYLLQMYLCLGLFPECVTYMKQNKQRKVKQWKVQYKSRNYNSSSVAQNKR